MCGIAGIVSQAPIDAAYIQRMGDVLAHRGPDGQGFMLSQGVHAESPLPGLIEFSPVHHPYIPLQQS